MDAVAQLGRLIIQLQRPVVRYILKSLLDGQYLLLRPVFPKVLVWLCLEAHPDVKKVVLLWQGYLKMFVESCESDN